MLIINAINYYYLLSQAIGISVPPNMVEKILDFAMGSYASRALTNLEAAEFDNKIEIGPETHQAKQLLLHQQNRMLGLKVSHSITNIRTFIHFDFEGWETPIGDIDAIYKELKVMGLTGIYVEVDFSGREDALAEWNPGTFTLTLFTKEPRGSNIQYYEELVSKMHNFEAFAKTSIIHELQHLVQNIGQFIKKTKIPFGLPPRKLRNKDVDPIGMLKSRETGEELGWAPHAFRDIEFYTNLGDAVNYFKHLVKEYGYEEHKRLFAKIFIGVATDKEVENFEKDLGPLHELIIHKDPDSLLTWTGYYWFAHLRKDPKRWKLAVSKFMQAVI